MALLVTLLLMAWQALAVQTHVHLPRPIERHALISSGSSAHRGAPSDTDGSCLLCRELAATGHTLLPALPLFVPPAPFVVAMPTAFIVGRLARQAAHRWRSRDPPVDLQPSR